jgi:hypothetical protein
MNRILGIFRKDARHLWPQALLFWATLAAVAAIDPLPEQHSSSLLHQLLPLLQPLACWLLVVSAIHGENLIGHEQYWLTRPYSWKHLIAAKGLFLLVFVNLPLLVCQFATLAALGISPLAWLPALLWRQVFFTIAYVLPAAALASVTRNLGQVVLAGILVCTAFAAGLSLNQLIQGHWPGWGAVEWIRECGVALVTAAGTAAALIWQYSRRKTTLARAALACTMLIAMLVMTAPRWGGAFAIQRLFSRERIGNTAVRISLDASRAGARLSRWTTNGDDPQGVRLEIPIRVDDVPPGTALALDQISVSLESARRTWRSGWLTFTALHDLSHGEAWLTAYVDPPFYSSAPDAPVQLDATMDLTLSRHVRTRTVSFGQALIPEIGICTFEDGQYYCASPFQRVSVKLAPGSPAFPELTTRPEPYAPFPTSAGFRPVDPCLRMGLSAPGGYSLVTARPVAHLHRSFQIRSLRMSQFRCCGAEPQVCAGPPGPAPVCPDRPRSTASGGSQPSAPSIHNAK